MILAIAYRYMSTSSYAAVIDTSLLPSELRTTIEEAVANDEEEVYVSFSEMKNVMPQAQVDTFPITIDGILDITEED